MHKVHQPSTRGCATRLYKISCHEFSLRYRTYYISTFAHEANKEVYALVPLHYLRVSLKIMTTYSRSNIYDVLVVYKELPESQIFSASNLLALQLVAVREYYLFTFPLYQSTFSHLYSVGAAHDIFVQAPLVEAVPLSSV